MNTHTRRLATGLCLLAGAWTEFAAAQQACPQPLGVLDSLLVQGQRLSAIDANQFLVERNSHAVAMNIGDPLCEADRMATQPNVTAKLLVGRADGKRHELTILPGATVVLRAINRVELLLGRLIGAVHGEFDVVMPFARLAATGTVFEVDAGSSTVAVDQLEGETHLTPTNAATAVLAPLTRVSGAGPGGAAVTALDASRCTELVSQANRMDIAFLPPVRSRNAIPQIAPATADSAYDSARQNAICRDDPSARQLVGRILTDWERPQQALEELRGTAGDSVAVGKALLMRGEPQRALGVFQRAGAAGGNAVDVSAGMGDAKRDLGILAIRGNQVPAAAAGFEEVRTHYVEAIRLASTDDVRGRLFVSLGDLALLRIRLDPDSAEARMTEAAALYQRAREHGDPPHARLGVARISVLRAMRIPTQQIDGSEAGIAATLLINIALDAQARSQRRPHWQQAMRDLHELLAAVPEFSPAQELMGEVQIALGERDAAQRHLKQAIAADPGNTSAYGVLAQTLSGGKKAMYEGAYKLVEVPAVREIEATRQTMLFPTSPTVTIPPAPLTPDKPELGFARPRPVRADVTLTNRSDAPVTVASTGIVGDAPSAFRIVSNGCSSGPVAVGSQCRIEVEFTAQSPGKYRAILQLSFATGGFTRDIKLHGEIARQSGGEGEGIVIL